MTSGVSSATSMRNSFLPRIDHSPASNHGILGCTETQVTANVVARQLHTISQVDLLRHVVAESSRVKIKASVINGSESGTGNKAGAAVVPYWRRKRTQAMRSSILGTDNARKQDESRARESALLWIRAERYWEKWKNVRPVYITKRQPSWMSECSAQPVPQHMQKAEFGSAVSHLCTSMSCALQIHVLKFCKLHNQRESIEFWICLNAIWRWCLWRTSIARVRRSHCNTASPFLLCRKSEPISHAIWIRVLKSYSSQFAKTSRILGYGA